MGTFDSSPSSSVHDATALFTKWIAESNIVSKAPYVNAISLNVKLSVQNIQGSLVNTNAFDAPILSTVSPGVGSSSGCVSVTVCGKGLQLAPNSLSVRVGFSASRGTMWLSDSVVAALTSSGAAGALVVFASIGLKYGSLTSAMTYNNPIPLFIAMNSPDTGAIYVTLSGRHLSDRSQSPVLKILSSSAESSSWISESSLVAKLSAGSARFAPVSVTVSMLASLAQSDFAVSFNVPIVSSVRQSMLSTGSSSISVFGRRFGHADMTSILRISGSSCETSTWISESSVSCKSLSGSGRSLSIVVSSVIRSGSLSSAFSYEGYRPPFASLIATGNGPTTGSLSVTVFGGQYSSVDRSHRIRISSASSSLAAVWTSDSSLSGKVLPGVGSRNHVAVSHGRQSSLQLSRVFSYDTAVLKSSISSNSPASGSSSVTSFGSGFGMTRNSAKIRFGLTHHIASSWVSDSSVLSKFPA